jgi:hypothetical protein
MSHKISILCAWDDGIRRQPLEAYRETSHSACHSRLVQCFCILPVGVVLCSSNVYLAILGRRTSQTCRPLSDSKAHDAISLSYPGRHCIRDTEAIVRIVYCGFLLSEFMSQTFKVSINNLLHISIKCNHLHTFIVRSLPPLASVLPSECQSTVRQGPLCALTFRSYIGLRLRISHF